MESVLKYPESELELKSKVEQLNSEWLAFLIDLLGNEHPDIKELFVSDGFYPNYTN